MKYPIEKLLRDALAALPADLCPADATHDVFLKAFRKYDQFRGESSVRTWLYRIAINHCRNLQTTWHERHMVNNVDEVVWETTPARSDSPLKVIREVR